MIKRCVQWGRNTSEEEEEEEDAQMNKLIIKEGQKSS